MAATTISQAQIRTALGGFAKLPFAWMIAISCMTLVFGNAANAQGSKIGFVNTERILRDSAPAKTAQTKIESEFKKREEEIQRLGNNLRTAAQKFEKDAPVLSESDRNKRQRELANIDADLQRKRRELQEDFNRRRNEEFATIIERANTAIRRIAEKDNYDMILQDAVTVNPRVDITDKVIQALGAK